jgi:hypothetical protein
MFSSRLDSSSATTVPACTTSPRSTHRAAAVAGRATGPAAAGALHELAKTAERAAALGLRPLVAHCRLSAGELCTRQGHPARARAHLAEAGALYHALGMPLYAARVERVVAGA